MANNNTYRRPVIVWGNSFYINIALQNFVEGEYVDFDLTKVTDLKVSLICATHNTVIPLEYEIIPDIDNVLRCFVDYRLLHTTSYGIVVEGYDEHDIHFRFSMLPKEGFLVVNNTSGMEITDEVQTIDISGRVGWGISTTGDLTNYYTKTEVNNIIAGIEVEIGDTYTKEEVNQLLTQYPTKTEINTRFNDYYTKTQTNNLLNQKVNKSELATVATTGDYNDLTNKPNLNNYATKSDLNNYYDKGQTDGMLNNKVDTSTLVSEYYNKNTVNNLLDAKADTSDLNDFYDKQETNTLLNQKANVTDLNNKQDTLVSGTNIKTINNESILGSGNIDIQGGGTQEQADWAQTDTTAVDYIKNKPDLSIYAETNDLSTVATTGDYDDLTNKPDLSIYTETNDLSTVATTGDYDDLTNKPDLSIYATQSELNDKQDTLVSGTNIKTINNESLLGSGNIDIQGGGNPDAEEVTANALNDLNQRLGTAEFNIETIPVQMEYLENSVASTLNQFKGEINDSLSEISTISDEAHVTTALVLKEHKDEIDAKQDLLVSAQNIKTINSQSILGSGDLTISGGVQSDWNETDTTSLAYIQNKPTINEPGFIKIGNGLVNSLSTYVDNTAIGNGAVIEGSGATQFIKIKAQGNKSHAEGEATNSYGLGSHAEGFRTAANGNYSHAGGSYTEASNYSECAIGQYNISTYYNNNRMNVTSATGTLFSIGNGTSASAKHNAFEVKMNGDIYLNDGSHPISSTTNGLKIEIVNALPASPENNCIYVIL